MWATDMPAELKSVRTILGCAVLLAGAASTGSADAAGETVSLELTAESGAVCSTLHSVSERVERLLGRSVFVEDGATLDISMGVTRTGNTFQAELEVHDREGRALGRRSVTSSSCNEIRDALVLTIAVALDPDSGPPMDTLDPVLNAVEDSEVLPQEQPDAQAPEPVAGWGVRIQAGASLTLGPFPRGVWGGGGRLLVRPPGFVPLELGLRASASQDVNAGAAGASVSLIDVSLGACPLGVGRRARLLVCVDVGVGIVKSRGFGFDTNRASSALVWTLNLRTDLNVPLTRGVSLFASINIGALVRREDFFYEGADGQKVLLFRMFPLAGTFELGVAVDFL